MKLSEERLSKGLCPRCGKEAAPYRLCRDHRMIEMIGRMMSAGVKAGAVSAVHGGGRGRPLRYSLSGGADDAWKFSPAFEGALGFDDRRYRPCFGKIPADVEHELVGILTTFGRPVGIEEIVAAWGKLRETRKTASIVGDMTALVLAQRRREARNLRRLGLPV